MDYLKNSLFKPTNKVVKFTKDSITIIEGAHTYSHLSLTGWSVPYEQYFQSTIFLKQDTYNQEINYGGLGTQITFLAIKVTYEPTEKKLIPDVEIPSLQYFFATNPDDIRYINNLLILTGTNDKKLPKIFINNPNTKFKAKVEIIASTTEIHSDELVGLNIISDTVFDIQDLDYTNIVSDDSGYSIIVQRDAETPLANLALDRIANIELNGRLMIVDDNSLGKINLFFKTKFDCLQAYSLINWAMKNIGTNIITLGMLPDTTVPVITYAPSFTTDINILDYPINGSNGSDGYSISKDILLDLLVDSVEDDRDGSVYFDKSNVTLTKVNQNIKREAINEVGKFQFIFEITDTAGNKQTDVFILNIKDDNAPKIILTDFGFDMYNNSTAGTSGLVNQTPIYVNDFTGNKISKQELLTLIVDQIHDIADGNINVNLNNVSITITGFNDNIIYQHIENGGIYDIYIQVEDSNGNIGNGLWENINTPLLDISNQPFNHLLLEVRENQAPDVIFTTNIVHNLYTFGSQITKVNLKTLLIDNIVDDRDGVMINSILNLSVHHVGENSTSGTETFVDGTDTYLYDLITETEILYIDQSGVYKLTVTVVDSDGEIAVEEINLLILE